MFGKNLLKSPILVIGILFCTIFLYKLRDTSYWKNYREKLSPTTCSLSLPFLRKKNYTSFFLPQMSIKNIECKHNNLWFEIESKEDIPSSNLYNFVAETLKLIAATTKENRPEEIYTITVRIHLPEKLISAQGTGEAIAKLNLLKSPKEITQHLHQTVLVGEQKK